MLPISARAEAPSSPSGSVPSMRHSEAASCGGKTMSALPCRSRVMGTSVARTSRSASPAAATASSTGSARTCGTEMSTGLPMSVDRAVPAVPDPMFASSPRASSCCSV